MTTVKANPRASEKSRLIHVLGVPNLEQFDLSGFEGTERLSTPFNFRLTLHPRAGFAFDLDHFAEQIVGKSVSLTIAPSNSPADRKRRFEGEAASVSEVCWAEAGGMPGVTIEIWPRLWRLSRQRNTRLFADQSIEEVVSSVLMEHEIKFAGLTGGVRSKRPFVWQLDETDLGFVERLLESEGYVYWFTFPEVGQHLLNIACGTQDLPALAGTLQMGRLGAGVRKDGHVAYIRRTVSAVPVTASVYSRSEDGNSVLKGTARRVLPGANGIAHIADGHAATQSECEKRAQLFLNEQQASRMVIEARTDIRAISAGTIVSIRGAAETAPKAYRVVAVRHEAHQSSAEYSNGIDAVSADSPLAVERSSPPPATSSTLATVVGPPDDRGRYCLKFDIDCTQATSAPVPLGRETDVLFLPRPGHRVEVGFLDNDPNRPVIQRLIDAPGELPFDPSENPAMGGVFTPLHEHIFNHDPAEPYVQMHTLGDLEDHATGERTIVTDKDHEEFVAGDADYSIGKDVTWNVTGSHTSQTGKDHILQAQTLTLAGEKRIVLMVGRSHISITSAGIIINGAPLLHLNPPSARRPKRPGELARQQTPSKRIPKTSTKGSK